MHHPVIVQGHAPRYTRQPTVLSFVAAAVVTALAALSSPVSAGAQEFVFQSTPAAVETANGGVSALSPRAALQEYLRLAKAQDWSAAAAFLALPAGARDEGPLLARRLQVVLDQRLKIDLSTLSPLARGDTLDGDPSGDVIGTIPGRRGVELPVRLVRLGGNAPPHWGFSAATVASVDEWYDNLGAPWLRDHLSPSLMREGPWHVFYWQWMGLALALPLLLLLSWLASGAVRGLLGRLAARTSSDWDNSLVANVRGPVQLSILALAIEPVLGLLELNVRLFDFIQHASRGLVLIALFWGLLRVIRLAQHHLENAVWESGDGAQARTLVPLLGNFLRITLVIVAILVTLSQFGYPVGTLLAGLGIGGIAVALAAQKTVEHLFGSVSLAADRAFRVGDWVRAGATEGTIERIGLRSTSFRTNDRTVVRIPNGRLADERIETFGERDRMFLRTDMDLAHGTAPDCIDQIRDEIEAALRAHPVIWPDAVRVHVVGFTDSAIRLRVMAWFETQDWGEFLTIRHRLLMEFLRIVERNGSTVALPSRTVYHGSPPDATMRSAAE